MKAGIGSAGVLAVVLLAGQVVTVFAEEQGKETRKRERPAECKKGGESDAACKQRGEEMKARMEANREFMKTVMAEEDAHKALAMLREHMVSGHAERVAFHEKKMDERMTEVGQKLEKENVPQEKREEILKEMIAKMEERKAEGNARYEEMLAKMDALAAKEDLTKEDIRSAMRECRPERDGKGREGMEKRREHKEGEKGTHERKRKGGEGNSEDDKGAPDA